jgi:hypothetical protein
VGLDVGDVGRGHAGAGQRVAEHGLLRGAVGRREPVAAPVLVHGAAADHGQHGVAVGERVAEPLEHHDATALRPHEAVGARVEGLAAAVGRHHPAAREEHGHVRRQDQVHPGGQRHAALAGPQALTRQVHGHQRRRARGVDGHVRPLQAEHVREPPGGDAVGAAGGDVGVLRGRIGVEEHLVVVGVADADEHAGAAARQLIGRHPGVLQGLPGDLQQQALLRVHAGRLPRRDSEELGVEAIDVVDEAAVPARHGARRLGVRVVPGVDVPAIGRHLADRVDAVAEHPPEAGGIVGAAGEATAHADDGQRGAARALQLVHARLQLDGEQRQPLGIEPGDAIEPFHHQSFPSRWLSRRSTSSSLSCSMRSSAPSAGASSGGAAAAPKTWRSRNRAIASTVG